MKQRLGFIITIFATILSVQVSKASSPNIELTFNGSTSSSVYYLISVSEDVSYTTDSGKSGTISAGSGKKLWMPDKATAVAYTFSKPEAVTTLDLSWPTDAGIASKLTDVTISGLDNLNTLALDLNMLTWPIGGELPESCKVTYGTQNSIKFDIDYGNKINLGRYNTTNWEASWLFSENGQSVPESYYTQLADGTYQFIRNYTSTITLKLTHPGGLVLTTQPITFNKMLYEVLTLATDGRGSGTQIGISSNKAIKEQFLIGYDGTYIENDTYNLTLDIPFLENSARELKIEANLPEVITTLKLNDLGIRTLSLGEDLDELLTVDLKGNSLLPSEIPEILKDCPDIAFGIQNEFVMPVGGSGFTFDLKEQTDAGAVVEWLDEDGNAVPQSKYTVDDGKYTFTESAGSIRARLTIPCFPDYEIYSEYVDVNFQYSLLTQFSWADNSQIPSMITIESGADINVQLNSIEYELTRDTPLNLRLGSDSGSATLFSTDNGSIRSISFAGIGIYNLIVGDGLDNLETLDLQDNLFTPFNLPSGIPETCDVLWGQMQTVDIGAYLYGENGIDMIDFKDFDIEWLSSPYEEPVDANLYTEKGGFYLFDNVGKVFARLTNSKYPGLVFETTIVDFAGTFNTVFEFKCNDAPEKNGVLTLSGDCKLEINGTSDKDYSNGTRCVDFTAETGINNSNFVYTLKANFPERIVAVDLTGIGITYISFGQDLSGLEKLDLSDNYLHFKTFPRGLDCELILYGQRPVELDVDGDGIICFPDFTECTDIHLVDTDGNLIPETSYEISESNDRLQLKASVTNATIVFTGHPEFPGIEIYSAPVSFIHSGLKDIYESKDDFEISGNSIVIKNDNAVILLYHPNGMLAHTLKGQGGHDIPPGLYILVQPGGETLKIKL